MRSVCMSFIAYAMAGVGVPARAAELAVVGHPEPAHDSRFMVDFGQVDPPPAFKRFCDESPEECAARPPAKNFTHSPRRLEELDEVNRRVNRAISPETESSTTASRIIGRSRRTEEAIVRITRF